MHQMRPDWVLRPGTLLLRPLPPVYPEFSFSIPTLPLRPDSVPNARMPLLRPELRSNHPLHWDLTSPSSQYRSLLMLSIRQLFPEAIRIIILLPLVSWREPCASLALANVLWRLSRVVITGTFNSGINYIFSSY